MHQFRSDKPLAEELSSFDMLGLGYPIHAFNAPQAFHKFIKSLPEGDKPYFIFKVSGEPFHLNDASSFHSVKFLNKKGYRLIGEKHFLMPYNIIFRYPDALAKQMDLYLGPLCEAFVKGLLEGKAEKIPYKAPKKVLSFLLRIEWLAPKANAPFAHMNKKRCTSCGLCERQCPVGAISKKKNGRYKIASSKCAICMRCAMNCPQNAIVFGFMNPWKVNGPYQFEKLRQDASIDPHFIHEGMKGYFKFFLPYFRKQDELLKEYDIENPMDS